MASIFTRIVNGEIPCYKVAENEDFLAFLDVNPVRMGHVLVIPKREVDYVFDLDDDHLSALIVFSKEVAGKIKSVIPCKKVGVTVIGLEVPHAHIHLIPINALHDMDFTKPKMSVSSEELMELAEKLSRA